MNHQQNNQQNNQQIVDKYIEQKQPQKEVSEQLVTNARVVSIKHRVYALILFVVILFVGYQYVLPAYYSFESTQQKQQKLMTQKQTFEQDKLTYEKSLSLLTTIEETQPGIVTCLIQRVGCKELNEKIKSNFDIARDYVLLNSLTEEKMIVDEQRILANLNEYLLKRDTKNPNSRLKNGDIQSIIIGEPEAFGQSVFSLPVELEVIFKSKDGLLSFIENIDQNIPVNEAYRILYKIEKIAYNVVDYQEEQEVKIALTAYYYQ